MKDLCVSYRYDLNEDGLPACHIRACERSAAGLLPPAPVGDLEGVGLTFEFALNDYIEKLDAYVAELRELRAVISDTGRQGEYAVRVDKNGQVWERGVPV